jgi:hypothetical protein
VDYGGIFSSQDDIKVVFKALAIHFVVKDLGEMKTFVDCEILTNKAKTTVFIHQPKLIQHLKEQLCSYVKKLKEYKTPASPRSVVKHPDKEDIILPTELQTLFISGVGMLLFC